MAEIGENPEATPYSAYKTLGHKFYSLGEYTKAIEYLEKTLEISKENGDQEEEATNYRNLAIVFYLLGKNAKADEYVKKALTIRKEIGDRKGETVD